jgi:hypothetical protein
MAGLSVIYVSSEQYLDSTFNFNITGIDLFPRGLANPSASLQA